MKFIVIICAIAFPLCAFSQNPIAKQPVNSEKEKPESFEKYCINNAASLIQNIADKSVKFAGTIEKLKGSGVPNYKDYGIVLKENESQYYKIVGSEQILVVKSLFVLRLNYKNTKK